MSIRVGIGQDSHRFLKERGSKKCVIAGLVFEEAPGLDADSDGDVVFHAICNAITSITHVPILGGVAINLCHERGITDSAAYLGEALKTLEARKRRIENAALTIEGKRPKLQRRIDEMRGNIAALLRIDCDRVGITVTSGDGLTAFGRGAGLMCIATLTTDLLLPAAPPGEAH